MSLIRVSRFGLRQRLPRRARTTGSRSSTPPSPRRREGDPRGAGAARRADRPHRAHPRPPGPRRRARRARRASSRTSRSRSPRATRACWPRTRRPTPASRPSEAPRRLPGRQDAADAHARRRATASARSRSSPRRATRPATSRSSTRATARCSRGDAYSTLGGVATTAKANPRFPLPAMSTWHRPTALETARALRASTRPASRPATARSSRAPAPRWTRRSRRASRARRRRAVRTPAIASHGSPRADVTARGQSGRARQIVREQRIVAAEALQRAGDGEEGLGVDAHAAVGGADLDELVGRRVEAGRAS